MLLKQVFFFFFGTIFFIAIRVEKCHSYDYDDNETEEEEEDEDESGYEPSFDVPIVNVTVVAGQTAVLPCSIEYLGKHKVAWLDSKSMPLTYEDRRVVDDFRFSVVRPIVKEWNLQIRDIRYEDQGQYRCTINTLPVKSKMVSLHVKVPASIIDELSSNDVTVREGDTVVLVCNVTGVPKPDVTWYQQPRDGKEDPKQRIGQKGEMMIISNITRHCTDVFVCIASNGVPPSVSRKMRVTVEFRPEVTLPNKRLGQVKGRETILECSITAYPQAVTFWEKNEKKITSSSKYRIEAYDEGNNNLILSLRINPVDPSDFGKYRCVASNSLGQDNDTMELYEYQLHSNTSKRQTSSRPTFTHQNVNTIFLTSVSKPLRYSHHNATLRHGAQVFRLYQEMSNERLSSGSSTTHQFPFFRSSTTHQFPFFHVAIVFLFMAIKSTFSLLL